MRVLDRVGTWGAEGLNHQILVLYLSGAQCVEELPRDVIPCANLARLLGVLRKTAGDALSQSSRIGRFSRGHREWGWRERRGVALRSKRCKRKSRFRPHHKRENDLEFPSLRSNNSCYYNTLRRRPTKHTQADSERIDWRSAEARPRSCLPEEVPFDARGSVRSLATACSDMAIHIGVATRNHGSRRCDAANRHESDAPVRASIAPP